MTRYAKPDTGRVVSRIESYVESTTVQVVTWGESFFALAACLPLAIAVNAFFALFFLPALIYIVLGLAVYLPMTTDLAKITKYTKHYYEAKYKILTKLRGSMEYDIAMPMVRKIYDHTLEGHPGGGQCWNDDSCSICMKRLKVLRDLVPNKPSDESDMEFAKMWLDEKKKLMLNA